jgi:hypothetical protein
LTVTDLGNNHNFMMVSHKKNWKTYVKSGTQSDIFKEVITMNRHGPHSLYEELTTCKLWFDANLLKFQLGRIVVSWH